MLTTYSAFMATVAYTTLRLADQSPAFSLAMSLSLLVSIPSIALS